MSDIARLSIGARAATLSTAVLLLSATSLSAQQAAEPAPLPQITVEAAKKKAAKASKKQSAAPVAKKAKAAPPPAPAPAEPVQAANPYGNTGGPTPNAKGDIGYNATRTSTATKTDTPLRNVPQSISVITDEQIKDQNIKSISEAVRYVPGVTPGQGEGNRDTVIIRGQNTTADFFVDGIRDDAQVYRDFYNVERLEVLKGPSALIFGRGGGGGVINRVTKQADFFSLREGTVSVGMFDHYRASTDVNYVINPNVAVRFNGMYEDSGSYRDGVELERWGVNPTITIRPSSATRIVLGYEHFEDFRTADRGIPSVFTPPGTNSRPAATSRSTFFGAPDLSFADATVDQAYAIVEHKFTSDLKLRNHTRYVNYDKTYQNVYAATSANFSGVPQSGILNGEVGLQAYNNESDRENIFNQTDVTYKVDMGIMRHTLLAGAEFGRQNSMGRRLNGFFNGAAECNGILGDGTNTETCRVNFADPTISRLGITFGVNPSNSLPNSDTRSHLNVRSFYVQDQIELTRYLEIIGGVRHDTFDLEVDNLVSATSFSREDNVVSPRGGIVLKPTDRLSIYGSYSVSFLPFSGDQFTSLDTVTTAFEPEKFTNYEVGAKWDITPALSLAAAHYWLTRENSRFNPPAPGPGQPTPPPIQTGETEVEGTEITLTGYVTDKWQVAAGYAHQYGEVTSATTVTPGTELPNVPRNTFSMWNRYQFTDMWGAGIGVIHRDDMIAVLAAEGAQVILPEYTSVDAALYFKLNDNLRAQVNVENIFNEKYFLNAHTKDNIQPGPPTTAYFSITSNF